MIHSYDLYPCGPFACHIHDIGPKFGAGVTCWACRPRLKMIRIILLKFQWNCRCSIWRKIPDNRPLSSLVIRMQIRPINEMISNGFINQSWSPINLSNRKFLYKRRPYCLITGTLLALLNIEIGRMNKLRWRFRFEFQIYESGIYEMFSL